MEELYADVKATQVVNHDFACLLNGRIKKVEHLELNKNGKVSARVIFSFNEAGFMTEKKKGKEKTSVLYNPGHYPLEVESASGIEQFVYNEKGKLAEKIFYGKDKQLRASVLYLYDEQNRLVEKFSDHLLPSEHDFRYLYSYDDQGNECEMRVLQVDPNLERNDENLQYRVFSRQTKTFNEQNRCVEEVSEELGNILSTDFFEYNENGNEIFRKTQYSSHHVISYVSEYTSSGRLRSRKRFKNEVPGDEETHEYDEQDKLKKSNYPAHVRTYSYDENGRIIEMTSRSDDSKPPNRYCYLYDDAGNIVKQTGPQGGYENKITYY